ncbi:MAG: hypothetical protein HY261_00225 [Chloroflexi bacterium]|nr:hypothetical protein [Chloroflexota bacterium]
MLTHDALQALVKRSKPGVDVLSVYFDEDASTGLWKDKLYRLKRTLDTMEQGFAGAQRKAFAVDRARVEGYIGGHKSHGQSLAIFSSQAQDLWSVTELRIPMRDEVRYAASPYVRPLARLFDDYQRYAVALVDNEKARLFVLYLGEIEEQRNVQDRVPKRHSQTEHQAKVEQRHATKVRQHVRHAIEALTEMRRAQRFNRLIIGGASEALSKFEQELPKELTSLVVGRISVDMHASDGDVLGEALKVERRFEEEKETRTVEQLVTRGAKHHHAVLGGDETLLAIRHGDVFELVVAADFTLKGCQCSKCGLASATIVRVCPRCAAAMKPVDDIVEIAIEQSEGAGARVEVVTGPARARLVKAAGGIGALLTDRAA